MPKLRKQRRKKVYKHNVNRKRLRNKIFSTGNIGCKDVKNAWDEKKSVQTNMEEMGLSYDPNRTLGIPKRKRQLQEAMGVTEEPLENPRVPAKKFVAERLEADAKAPREKRFRLPKGQVEWITYLLKKHGTDYKAMARDNKNYLQETWKQLRQKVRTFKRIPEQYGKYLEESGARPVDSDAEQLTDDEL
ncbi:nucleolar protein 16 [Dendroctonus ponderosae]|uniref:Nucleolar protein 16 n=1 Tax=Dendroctonus ponderosae TaxID=77166 RepID=J3JVB7_DENPD